MAEQPKLEAEVTVTEKTKVSVQLVAWASGFLTSFIVGAVVWGIRTESKANQALDKVVELKSEVQRDVNDIRSDVKDIREAQIRMEAAMGISPSYFMGDDKKKK